MFPDGGTVVIDRFGEYEERPYVVHAVAEGGGLFRLCERQIASIRESLENSAGKVEIGGGGLSITQVFSVSDLVAAGFEEAKTE